MNILSDVISQVRSHYEQFLKKIQEERGNPTIPLFINPITRGTFDNVYNMINSPEFENQRKSCENKSNVDVIIDSGGGDADAAYQIAKLFHRKFKGKITYIIHDMQKAPRLFWSAVETQ